MTEQEKEESFWKACGFEFLHTPYTPIHTAQIKYPDGHVEQWNGWSFLISDLNALFKYAVPVAVKKMIEDNPDWTVKRAETYIFQAWLIKKQFGEGNDFTSALYSVLCEILEVNDDN